METIVFITSRDKDIVSYIIERLPLMDKRIIVIKCLHTRKISVKWVRRKLLKLHREGLFNWCIERYIFKRLNRVLVNSGIMSLALVTQKKGYDYFEFNSVNDKDLRKLLAEIKPDLFLSIGNSWIGSSTYKSSLLATNLHLTKLPDYAGSIPIINELLNGENYVHATLHILEKKIDSGSILMESQIPIERTDSISKDLDTNFRNLLDKLVMDLIAFLHSSDKNIVRSNKTISKKILPKLIDILSYGKVQS